MTAQVSNAVATPEHEGDDDYLAFLREVAEKYSASGKSQKFVRGLIGRFKRLLAVEYQYGLAQESLNATVTSLRDSQRMAMQQMQFAQTVANRLDVLSRALPAPAPAAPAPAPQPAVDLQGQ
jgi:hypothetical protein